MIPPSVLRARYRCRSGHATIRIFWLVAALFLAATICVSGYQLVKERHDVADGTPAPYRGSIGAREATEAYEIMKAEYSRLPFAEQHEAAHLFGIALYDSEGQDGIAVCDAAFAFGCFHGFFARAVANTGTGIVGELAALCKAKFGRNSTGCEHGIGHGIMEYTGRDGLAEALSLCEKTGQVHPLYGCTSGLFMEYNSAMMFRDGVAYRDVRPYDPGEPLAPCDSKVPAKHRTSCYFEMGLWWKERLGDDYARIGDLCAQAATAEERDACYRGLGTVVAENVGHDAREAIRLCGQIDAHRGEQVCMLGVASRFYPAGHPEEGALVCASLESPLDSECAGFQEAPPSV